MIFFDAVIYYNKFCVFYIFVNTHYFVYIELQLKRTQFYNPGIFSLALLYLIPFSFFLAGKTKKVSFFVCI